MTWPEAVIARLTAASAAARANATPADLPSIASAWRTDLPAAIVVFLVALPLCLGIALASGAPLFAGIVSGIVGGVVVGTLSGSNLMVTGPAAGLTAVVVPAIATLGSFRAFLVAVVIGGLLQMLFAVLRAGTIAFYVPSTVIHGMLAAIGLILVLKQIPHALGYDVDFEGSETFLQSTGENTFTAIGHALSNIQPAAALLSVVALAMLVWWDRLRPAQVRWMPGPLAVVVVALAGQWLIGRFLPSMQLGPEHFVALPTMSELSAPGGMSVTPEWQAVWRPETWRIALTLAVVASLESLLSLEATDRLDPLKRDSPTDRELAAQGAGNVLAGLIGGLPMTGVVVRSAANVEGGARTRLATILQGVLLLITVATIPWLLNRIPLASLAAILIFIGFRLARPSLFAELWHQGPTRFVPFLVTVVAILLSDLLVGIGIGLAVGFVFVLWDQLRFPCYTFVSPPGAVLMRAQLQEHVSFLNKASLARLFDGLAPGSRLELDGSRCRHIDRDVLELIANFRYTARHRQIDFRTVGLALPSDVSDE